MLEMNKPVQKSLKIAIAKGGEPSEGLRLSRRRIVRHSRRTMLSSDDERRMRAISRVPVGKSHGAADARGGAIERKVVDAGFRADSAAAAVTIQLRISEVPSTKSPRAHRRHIIQIVLLERLNKFMVQLFVDLGMAESAGTDDDDALVTGNTA